MVIGRVDDGAAGIRGDIASSRADHFTALA
jgi:hypothetical protein